MAEKVEVIITGKDELSGPLGGIQKALGGLGSIAKGVALGGVAVLGAGVAGLGAIVADSVGEAMAAQEVLAQLDAVLKSTGGTAGVTKEQVLELASTFQGTTRFSDEMIISGQNMLLTFTNIGKDVFPLATETMLDMSQALGQDLKSSAIQLGKALQDPVAGVTALRRVGVNFTKEQQEMIKGLVESGNLLEAQNFILKELQTEFGGSAEAAGKTFAGQLDILKNRFSDIKETIGMKVIPILTKLMDKVIIPLIPFVEKAADAFGNLLTKILESKEFQAFINNVSDGLQGIVKLLTGLMGGNIDIKLPKLEAMIPEQVMNFFQSEETPGFFETLQKWWAQYGPQIKASAAQLWDGVVAAWDKLMEKVGPFIDKVWGKIKVWLEENGPLIKEFVDTIVTWFTEKLLPAIVGLWDVLEPLLLGLVDLLLGLAKIIMQVVVGDWSGAWETAKQVVYDVVKTIIETLGRLGEWIMVNVFGMKDWEGTVDNAMSMFPEKFATIEKAIKEIYQEFWAWLKQSWAEVAGFFEGVLIGQMTALAGAIFGIVSAIATAVSSVWTLAEAFAALVIPDWLIPGSPTPLENGLRGINSALDDLALSTMPSFAPAPAMAGGSVGGGINVHINWQPTLSTASEADVERLIPLIRRGTERALKDLKR